MSRNHLLQWVTLCLLALTVSACGAALGEGLASQPAQRAPEAVLYPTAVGDPTEAARDTLSAFYGWYLDYEGNPLVDRAYRERKELSPEWIAQVDDLLSTPGKAGYDPFLCAQDRPGAFAIDELAVTGDRARASVSTDFAVHHLTVELVQREGRWMIDAIVCAPPEATSRQLVPPQEVVIDELGLVFEVPGDWQRMEPGWVWTNPPRGGVVMGVKTCVLTPPMEIEAAFTQQPSEVMGSVDLETGLGSGRRVDVKVLADGEPRGDQQAAVSEVQSHVLITVNRDGTRFGIDLYLTGESMEALAPYEGAFRAMVASIRPS